MNNTTIKQAIVNEIKYILGNASEVFNFDDAYAQHLGKRFERLSGGMTRLLVTLTTDSMDYKSQDFEDLLYSVSSEIDAIKAITSHIQVPVKFLNVIQLGTLLKAAEILTQQAGQDYITACEGQYRVVDKEGEVIVNFGRDRMAMYGFCNELGIPCQQLISGIHHPNFTHDNDMFKTVSVSVEQGKEIKEMLKKKSEDFISKSASNSNE